MNISGFPPQYSLILHLKVLTFIGHDGLSVVIALEERTTVHTYWRIIDFLPSDTDVCNKKNMLKKKSRIKLPRKINCFTLSTFLVKKIRIFNNALEWKTVAFIEKDEMYQ
ncbi:hypothetical protein L5515_017093 [Caenorhabditis briggsae]|uniref:Uncharacterized protein n=1 Tax=Caenorhabditis briggsae TaxID=6238 RepID=A0AAE9JR35_CAEBR|nr:hypothetical protein L5515_017093 [Caenorhabditis briggsae]